MSLRPCLTKFFISTSTLPLRKACLGEYKYRPFGFRQAPRRTISDFQQVRLERIVVDLHRSCVGLREAAKDAQPDDVIMHWSELRRILLSIPEHLRKDLVKKKLDITDLVGMAGVLSKRGNAQDAQILVELFMECPRILSSGANVELLQKVVSGLVRAKQSVKAYDILRSYHRYPAPGSKPNSVHFLTVMTGLRRAGDIERLKECLRIMKSTWPYPNVHHYRELVKALVGRPHPDVTSATELKEIIDEMDATKLPYDQDIYTALSSSPGLNSLAERYKSKPRNVDKAVVQQWITDLQNSRRSGRNPFQQKFKLLRAKGFLPDVYSFGKIVDGSGASTVEELEYIRDVLEVEPNVVVWSILIKNTLSKRGVWDAIETYEAARASGIRPDAKMLHPILMRLCSGRFTQPPEEHIDRALDLYMDLVKPQPRKTTDKEDPSVVDADTAIYNTLLRALTSHSNAQKYFPRAFAILGDMRRRHLSMDAMTAASVVILLIRSSSSYDAAYSAYRQVKALKGVALDCESYAAILDAYCSLEVKDSFPSVKHYFAIVNDMQAAGIPKTEKIYTILLGRYAKVATHLQKLNAERKGEHGVNHWRLLEDLLVVIQDTHHQLTLDASVTPDAPLWNQLMDAYNRVGYFKGVLDVWAILTSSGQVNNASISVMLDACGFHSSYGDAKIAFTSAQSTGFALNIRNWNSWIECLARLGRLDEALQVACFEMPRSTTPDESTVQLLLSFSGEANKEEVHSLVQRHLPEAWAKYKKVADPTRMSH